MSNLFVESMASEESRGIDIGDAATEWGTASDAQGMCAIVQEMLEAGIYSRLILKAQVVWDCPDGWNEALNGGCIQLGLSDEDCWIACHDQGCKVKIIILWF